MITSYYTHEWSLPGLYDKLPYTIYGAKLIFESIIN
jgi:hypothetical protein